MPSVVFRGMLEDDLHRYQQELLDGQLDITGAPGVDVVWNEARTVLWVNVCGVCVLRVCRIKRLNVGEAG